MVVSCHICGKKSGLDGDKWLEACEHQKMIVKAMIFSRDKHKGQTISDGKPYTIHLNNVAEVLRRFKLNTTAEVEAACYLHDVIEDTGTNFEEVRANFGDEVVDTVWRVTDAPGKNRKERKAATYPKIKGFLSATTVKLCDRIANVEYDSGGDKEKFLNMYRSEYESFREGIYVRGICEVLWGYLEKILFPDLSVAARHVSQDLLEEITERFNK